MLDLAVVASRADIVGDNSVREHYYLVNTV